MRAGVRPTAPVDPGADLLDQLGDAVVAIDRASRVTHWNRAAAALYGIAAAEALGCVLTDLYQYHWLSPDDERRAYEALARDGRWQGKNLHVLRSGEERFVESTVTVVRDAEGKDTGLVAVIREQTDRVRAEQALRDAQDRLEAALDASPIVLFTQDLELRTTWVHNQRLGLPPEDYLGKTDLDVFDLAEEAERLIAIKRRALETRQLVRAEVCVRLRGRTFWYDLTVRPQFRDGRPCGVLGAAIDVTERKQAEEARASSREALRVTSERLEAAQSVGGIGIFDWEIPGDRVYWSAEVYKLMGRPPGALPASSQAWHDALVDEDREIGPAAFREAALARRERYEVEMRLRQPGGGSRWVRISALVRYGDRGEPVRILGTIVDIEVLKQAAEAREAERRRLLRLLEQVPAMINVLHGPDLVIEFAHPITLARLAGRDITGKPLLEVIPELRGQPHPERLRRVYETGEPDFQREVYAWAEVSGRRLDMYWDSAYLPVCDASGRIEGVMTFDVDVTQGVLARRELEVASRTKDEFLATVSHELRTPLQAILGWASLLQQTRDERKLARGLEVIARNALAQERIVSDLLDVSRIISGKLQLALRRTEVSAVVLAAVDVVRPAALAKGVRLVVDLDPEVGAFTADADRLQQIAWNLLVNAVRFTPHGGRITVSAARAGAGVQIVVADTGRGIPSEHLPHIFERFRQVDSSPTRVHGGLGLGLAIVRHLVEAHGGYVEARSEGLERGATFAVYLPTSGAEAPNASSEAGPDPGAAATAASPEARASLGGVRVLLVDDDPDSLELLRAVLGGAGAVVTAAGGAREALGASGPFDVIVSDIGMPEMDGHGFIQHIRSRDGAAVPAIALTAYAHAGDAERALGAGFDAHLKKPVEPVKLVAAIRAQLARGQGALSPH
ncbi:MAG TPA: PAS domain-containing protein [Kofleriaceae bacterium]